MKKLLIICPHYNDNHVSSFRIKQIEKQFKEKNIDVKILTLSDSYSCERNGVFYINDRYFKNNMNLFCLPNDIKVYLLGVFSKFDSIYVSMPSFQFIKLLKYIPETTNIFLDYRDQIDLDYFIRKHKYNNCVLKLVSFLDMKFSYFIHERQILKHKNILKIFCVGDVATDCFRKIFKRNKVEVVNIHNGFFNSDSKLLNKSTVNIDNIDNVIKIGLSGSVYEFRCSNKLKLLFLNIDFFAKENNLKIEIWHWGNSCDKFLSILGDLEYVNYLPQGRVDRDKYLSDILNVDYLLLLCSDDILWEPTTTVFDYILMRKPIIYSGNVNNEACHIMNSSNVHYLTSDNEIKFSSDEFFLNSHVMFEDIKQYSREFNVEKLYEAMTS